MDVGRVIVAHVGPEDRIFKLKFQCTGGIVGALGQKKQTCGDIFSDPGWLQFAFAPERHPGLRKPFRGFLEDIGDCTDVLCCRLPDPYIDRDITGPVEQRWGQAGFRAPESDRFLLPPLPPRFH